MTCHTPNYGSRHSELSTMRPQVQHAKVQADLLIYLYT